MKVSTRVMQLSGDIMLSDLIRILVPFLLYETKFIQREYSKCIFWKLGYLFISRNSIENGAV
jgi:hypothetical protein